jgi:hypothetical protein
VGETPEQLNPLALATYKVGGKKRCIALLRKSLEIRSDQGEIRRFLERVETEIDKNMTERSP